jgi:membrane-bound lytic murein transglycosylase MltF
MGLTLVLVGIFLMFMSQPKGVQDETVTVTPEPTIHYANSHIVREGTARKLPNARTYARKKLSDKEFHYLDQLVYLESKWDPNAQNPYSTAYGIGQFLDQTWETVGYEKTDDPYTQIDAMIDYVQGRYGSFEAALIAWYERAERTGHGWY